MSFERWGSLSVDDHVDTQALVANILLYDRLVIPVMTEQPDRDERAYWVGKGWDPDLQTDRLALLEELAIRRPWNKARREKFQTRVKQLAAERQDARIIDRKQDTREILAQEQVVEKPPGVQGVTVVAAYNSTAALKDDFSITNAKDHLSAQAYLLSRRLAVPADLSNPDKSIREAIKLSRDQEFQARRNDLFDWQDLAVARGWRPQDAVERISEMADRYNVMVEDAVGKVRWKFAFTIFGIGIAFATGGLVGAAAAATLSVIQFVKLDRKPVIEAGNTQPAAMFHDIKESLGIQLH